MDASSPSAGGESGRIASLDGLRGFAILVVLIHNAAWIAGSSERFPMKVTIAATASGWVGVQLFFVLSGFLITGILLGSRGRVDYYRTFYVRRVLRIFPLYYAFLASVVLVAFLWFGQSEWAAAIHAEQWWYWLYLANWIRPFVVEVGGLGHLWSLAVEEQFYLFWPLVVARLDGRALRRLLVATIVLTPVLRGGLLLSGLPQSAGYFFTFARWDALAMGALLALLMRDDEGRALLARHATSVGVSAFLALLATAAYSRGFHQEASEVLTVGQSASGLVFAVLVYRALVAGGKSGSVIQGIAEAPWLRFFGKYSYAMYVFHLPIHRVLSDRCAGLVQGADDDWRLVRLAAYLLVLTIITSAAALVSWRLLEAPCLALKERWAPRSPGVLPLP